MTLSRLVLSLVVAAQAVLIPGEAGRALAAPMTWPDLFPSWDRQRRALGARGDGSATYPELG